MLSIIIVFILHQYSLPDLPHRCTWYEVVNGQWGRLVLLTHTWAESSGRADDPSVHFEVDRKMKQHGDTFKGNVYTLWLAVWCVALVHRIAPCQVKQRWAQSCGGTWQSHEDPPRRFVHLEVQMPKERLKTQCHWLSIAPRKIKNKVIKHILVLLKSKNLVGSWWIIPSCAVFMRNSALTPRPRSIYQEIQHPDSKQIRNLLNKKLFGPVFLPVHESL